MLENLYVVYTKKNQRDERLFLYVFTQESLFKSRHL